jgi:hypothetical protein
VTGIPAAFLRFAVARGRILLISLPQS